MFFEKQKYKLLLFDLDNTLWDFETNAREAIRDVLTEQHLMRQIADFDAFYDCYEIHNQRLWTEYEAGSLNKEDLRTLRFHFALQAFGINDHEQARHCGERYIALCPKKTALFPDTLGTLDCLWPKYDMAIITNGFAEVQHVKIAACGLDKYFQRIFISEETGCPKPHAGIFHAALTAFHCAKKNALMIGDNWKNDVEGAKRYGIDQVYYNPRGNPRRRKPTFEIRRLEQLKAFL
ncbi:MAG: YjjG family noncanonical pyrimidine nucleotidase [Prevotellaceae bacterium]|jgi:putative hydrolase of the HAD superfamily|nr:YjjG family noncanonical pyrimidine nucleotidase [Prevotellaceae bacterium]